MSSLHVLIIDNSIPHRKIMMRSMQDALGYLADGGCVEMVSNTAEVTEKLQTFHPHAIIVNFAMSIIRVHGERLVPWLVRTSGVPIIAYGLSEVLRPTAMSAGAEAFFLRPTTDADWPPFCSKVVRFLYRLVFLPEPLINEEATKAKEPPAPAQPSSPAHRIDLPKPPVTTSSFGIQMPKPSTPKKVPAEPPKGQNSQAEQHFAALARQAAMQHATAIHEIPHVTLPAAIQPAPKIDLIAIGASTGGTDAIADVMHGLTPPLPPIVIVQHIPSYFSRLFAIRLNEECAIDIEEASDDEPIYPNHAYIAPGGLHMTVAREGGRMVVRCQPGPKVHSVCPSVDVLFDSVAKLVGGTALGVILTGMGRDGAEGLLHMKEAGSPTLGQDEKTCVVYGMPRVAYECGAVAHQLPLPHIAPAILKVVGR
ncbi:chemotaxis protein CheB [uncultured Selenomonas sp.]|uniref:chemotaxis protein CheB n=1 Tax=uncultured Selenomonas sp. TaxID=159275 RepID=UPI0025CCA6BD|nr:chemotaxis protein CheB [uncultured Selenomonas sp.]